jgi:hypothetical protein
MNLFHPVAPRAAMESELQSYMDSKAADRSASRSPERISHREGNLLTLSNIIKEDAGNRVQMKNREIQAKTDEVQKEFDSIMNEIVHRRQFGGRAARMVPKIDDILDGYYMPGPERKHRSPTKRLINHKNSTTDYKSKI